MDKSVDIVVFNVPYPPDYGGVIDVFWRIKALSELGYSITLHCFQYGRERAPQLETWCSTVYYYRRRMDWILHLSPVPFIVRSRSSSRLLENLMKHDGPVLFEGLHTTWFLRYPGLSGRKKLVRTHNIEHDYYRQLALVEPNRLKKLYFHLEALKLSRYEKQLSEADALVAISENDARYFRTINPACWLVPPFHRDEQVSCRPGKGQFILYHGNLEIQENHQAALFILKEIAPILSYEIVIAGHSPCRELTQLAASLPHVELRNNPSDEEMEDLISQAHIHLLPSFQPTGFKLKLLHALFKGRFCLVTSEMVAGTGLEALCTIKRTGKEFADEIETLMQTEFTQENLQIRKNVLESGFSNGPNARKLDQILNGTMN